MNAEMVISGRFNTVLNKVVSHSSKDSRNYYSLRSFWQPKKYISVLQAEEKTKVPRNITICPEAPLDSGLAGETLNGTDSSSKLRWL